MSRNAKTLIYITAVLLISVVSKATTYYVDGREVSKGQALIAKAKNEKVKVTKVDEMEISGKGTLVKKD